MKPDLSDSVCSYSECERRALADRSECILDCEKCGYDADRDIAEFLGSFNQALTAISIKHWLSCK